MSEVETSEPMVEVKIVDTCEPPEEPGFDWGVLEIFGHRRHLGRFREEERFGAKVLRIDIPEFETRDAAPTWKTIYYAGAAVFSLSLTDKDSVFTAARRWAPAARVALLAASEPNPMADAAGFGADEGSDADEEVES